MIAARVPGTIAAKANAYFEPPLQLIVRARPSFVAVGGLSGTGKTILARRLARLLEITGRSAAPFGRNRAYALTCEI
jgi:adenylylsulfate kinase-like enzyme